MERKQLANETLLTVMELTTRYIGKYIKEHGRGGFVSNTEAVGAVTEALWQVIKENDAEKAEPQKIADAFLNIAAVCAFAVASMVVTEATTAPVEGVKDAPVDAEISKDLAHKKMLERRAEASGIIITDKLPS